LSEEKPYRPVANKPAPAEQSETGRRCLSQTHFWT